MMVALAGVVLSRLVAASESGRRWWRGRRRGELLGREVLDLRAGSCEEGGSRRVCLQHDEWIDELFTKRMT